MPTTFATSIDTLQSRFPREPAFSRIRRAGIKSIGQLIRAIEDSATSDAGFYCWILGQLGGRHAERALLRVLQGPRRLLWMQAGISLASAGSARAVGALTAMLQDGPPVRRRAAAYALGWIDLGLQPRQVTEALVSALKNRRNPPALRGQAAESVASILGVPKTTGGAPRVLPTVEATLINSLADHSPEVRFWCAYALGVLRCKAAIPALRRLARHDRAVLPGWWRVSLEAKDALTMIAGGCPPERYGRAVKQAAAPVRGK